MAKNLYQSMQTWDGILGGERLLTMSCSDKLCRWNFIGLQGEEKKRKLFKFSNFFVFIIGALLSTLIEPIYYTSIVIGSLYHSEHIRRALFARIEHVRELNRRIDLFFFRISRQSIIFQLRMVYVDRLFPVLVVQKCELLLEHLIMHSYGIVWIKSVKLLIL
jgi:hypothetical protein